MVKENLVILNLLRHVDNLPAQTAVSISLTHDLLSLLLTVVKHTTLQVSGVFLLLVFFTVQGEKLSSKS